MVKDIYQFSLVLIIGCFALSDISAQVDKEVIIIEKTIDENGNEVSKKIIRKNGSELNDDDLDELLENSDTPFGQWDIQSLGFGPDAFDDWEEWGYSNKKEPTVSIGLQLSFDNGRNIITDVVSGSGASDADIRSGDELIAIEGSSINSIDDIHDILQSKQIGDELLLTVYRDGQEIEKIVLLKSNRSKNNPFSFSNELNGRSFLFDLNQSFNMDSLLSQFEQLNVDSIFRNFEHGFNLQPFRSQSKSYNNEPNPKGSLGVFIDEEGRKVVVSDVIKDSAAQKAGIKKKDTILRIDDNMITSYSELAMIMNQKVSGETITLEIDRNGNKKKIEVVLD